MNLLRKISNLFSKKEDIHKTIKSLFGFSLSNADLYYEALTHKSYTKGEDINNERLEFLGDTVLDLIVAKRLFEEFPNADEGELTKVKAKIVSREHLLSLALAMEIDKKLHVKKQKSLNVHNIIGNVIEALFGAIFMDQGYKKTTEIINQILDEYIDLHHLRSKVVDFKSSVHEWAQSNQKKIRFHTISIGNMENTQYRSELYIDEKLKGYGEARNKKIAQRKASKMFWHEVGDQ